MSIWQTKAWQDMLVESGQSEEYFVVEQDIKQLEEKKYAALYVEKRKVSLGESGLFVIGYEGEISERTAETLRELCDEEKALFLQIETIDYAAGDKDYCDNLGGFQYGKYYKKFIPPYSTLIDLTQSEDEILAAMKQKGRYNIRLARKKGVTVEKVQKTSENIQKFHALMQETTSRDGFAGNTQAYYDTLAKRLDGADLYFAMHEGDLLAAGFFVGEGDVMTYYYGASTNHKRNLMPTYLLQWELISTAKKAGYQVYDFLGVAGDEEKNSSLAGVTDFKMRLSPKKTKVSESYIYIAKPFKYSGIQLLKKIKK